MNEHRYEQIYAEVKQRSQYFKHRHQKDTHIISSQSFESNHITSRCRQSISMVLHIFVRKDAQVLRWFRKHRLAKGIVASIALYSIFISTYFFIQERVAPLLTNDRQYILNNLPSAQYAKLNSVSNDKGTLNQLSENCSESRESSSVIHMRLQRKMTYLMPELYAFGDYYGETVPDQGSNEDFNSTCVAVHNAEMKTQEEMYIEDDTYLFEKLSPNSYWAFMGYHEAPIVTTKTAFIYNFGISILSIICLKKVGVSFFDI